MSIEVRQVNKIFNQFKVLRDVSLKVETGELVSLLGPSGSGKTTLVACDRWHGKRRSGQRSRSFSTAATFPMKMWANAASASSSSITPLFKHMSVFENVAFGLRAKPWRPGPRRRKFAPRSTNCCTSFSCRTSHRATLRSFPGGSGSVWLWPGRSRSSRAFLLLDEPFGALDATVRRELRRWLRKLHSRIHVTTILVTHDQEEALEVSDRVAVMNEGRIEQFASPEEIYDNPANPFVFKFLGNYNLFHGRKANTDQVAAAEFGGGRRRDLRASPRH